MLNNLWLAVAKIVTFCTFTSAAITSVFFLFQYGNPIYYSSGEISGFMLSIIIPILIAIPVSHRVLTQKQQLETLSEQLKQLLNYDKLTSLLTRDAFFQKSQELLDGPSRKYEEHALFFIDLDDFKNINDLYGHSTGDNTLKLFGEVVKSVIGDQGFAGRVGGEEFCLFLPNCTSQKAETIAQTLINKFRHHARVIEGKHINGTISVGISISNGQDDLDKLIRMADNRMYAAKAMGKNQFVLSEYAQNKLDVAA